MSSTLDNHRLERQHTSRPVDNALRPMSSRRSGGPPDDRPRRGYTEEQPMANQLNPYLHFDGTAAKR